jgi:hypothetical protein
MNFYSLGQLSNNEKSDILNKHKELYNGYRKVWQTVSNEQPLYIQDFANDKEGLVVTNKGNVKAYTNFGINEGIYDVQDDFTGEFDYTEEEIDEVNDEDLALAVSADGLPNLAVAMDEEEEYEVMTSAFMDEELDEISGPSPLYSKVDPAYNFQSDGPMQEEEIEEGFFDFMDDEEFEDVYDYDEKESAFDRIRRGKGDVEDIDFEEIEDEQLRESLLKQKNKINEMFNRIKKYN